MKLDRFALALLGPTADLGQEGEKALQEGAYQFLRAEGRLTLDDWAGMSEETRAAFMQAGERFRAENALLLAAAILDGKGIARAVDPEGAQEAEVKAALRDTLAEEKEALSRTELVNK